jgi:hypothetical protein
VFESPIKIGVPEEDGNIIKPVEVHKREFAKRSFIISREDVREHGMTPGCRGCLKADAGQKAVNHTPGCRKRYLDLFAESDPVKLQRITEEFIRDREGEQQHVNVQAEVGGADDLRNVIEEDDVMAGDGGGGGSSAADVNDDIVIGDQEVLEPDAVNGGGDATVLAINASGHQGHH